MNGIVKFIIGAAIGAGLGVLGSARYFKKKYETKADEEIAQMEQYYKDKLQSVVDGAAAKAIVKPYVSEETPVAQDFREVEAPKPPKTGKVDYTKCFANAQQTVAEEAKPMTQPQAKRNQPKLIRAEEFGNMPGQDRITLYYYTGNDILTNDEEDPYEVDVAELMVGDCLEKFGFRTNNEEAIYVRNLVYGADYEIIKVRGDFEGD